MYWGSILCSVVVGVVAIVLALFVEAEATVLALAALVVVVFAFVMWRFGWRNYLTIKSAGLRFTDPFGRTKEFEWSDIDSVNIEKSPTGSLALVVTADGDRFPVYATALDLLETATKRKRQWLDSIQASVDRLKPELRD